MDVSLQQFYQEMKASGQSLRPRISVRIVEAAAQAVFTVCAFASLLAVVSITLYMIAMVFPQYGRSG